MSLIDRVGAVFLLRSNDGASLLQLRDDKPGLRHARQWVPPGGHAKFEEEIDACARREFLEETGYNCTHLYKLHELDIKEKCDLDGGTAHLSISQQILAQCSIL